MGQNARKAKPTANPADNNGFDDERGDYLWNLHDHIAFRYEILGVLGTSRRRASSVLVVCLDTTYIVRIHIALRGEILGVLYLAS